VLYAAYMCACGFASKCCRPSSTLCAWGASVDQNGSEAWRSSTSPAPACRGDISGRKVWQHMVQHNGCKGGTSSSSLRQHTWQPLGREDLAGWLTIGRGLPVDIELCNAPVLAAAATAVMQRRCASVPRRTCRSTVMQGSSNDLDHLLHRRR